ncbi:hemolysin family protein [bacterium]|nr:hemolysin family protein [bacterium]MBU1984240.1 hemolysin family protein [bacterium]
MDAATALILAFVLSAYYSGMETAFTSFDRILITGWIRRRRIGARVARFLGAHPARFLSTALIGTNISNVALTTLVVVLVEASDIHTAWVVVATPFAILIFAELLPKMFGYSLANLAVRWTSLPLLVSYYIFAPFRALYAPVTRPLAGRGTPGGTPWKRQDLDQILVGAEAEGAVSPEEGALLTRYLDARELKVRQIMTPRTQLVAVSRDTPPDEVRELFRTTRYNVIPVYDGDLDHVIGYVSAKQFLEPSQSLDDLIRPLHAVPESKRIVELLHEFKTEHRQAALVIDEHGGTDGFVTLKDILEELIGSVAERIDPSQPVIKRIAIGKYLVSGSAYLDDIEQISGWKPPKTEAITLSGLLSEVLGRIANVAEEIEFDKVMIRVIRRTPRRVEACLFKIKQEPSPEAEDRG